MKLGPKLTRLQHELCKEVTLREIQDALFNIDSNKIHGIDGFTTCFSMKVWKIIQVDVQKAIKEVFFRA